MKTNYEQSLENKSLDEQYVILITHGVITDSHVLEDTNIKKTLVTFQDKQYVITEVDLKVTRITCI